MNESFNSLLLAADIDEVRRIYADFFTGLSEHNWRKPVKGWPKEWNLQETVAHLCALNGHGLQSIQASVRGETYTFPGLENRYQFNDFNRQGIDTHLNLPMKVLCEKLLGILEQSADIARNLTPERAEIVTQMPIYNRPVKVVEALGIIMFHTGLHHTAQVAEPANVAPLWQQLSPEIVHRIIGRVICALSLLYRYDLGGDLRTVIAFRIEGAGGGNWQVAVSPESAVAVEGISARPRLTIALRETATFCHMFTGRINLPLALLTGQIKLRGNLGLFSSFGTLFSVDARK